MSRRTLAAALLLTTACGLAPGDGATSPTWQRQQSSVIGGTRNPDELAFPINRKERNAALAQVVVLGGASYQGCSATLVGDRAVVSAGHCVIMNQDEFANQGAKPQVADASMLTFVAGEDVNHPLCRFEVERVLLHPGIAVNSTTGGLDHDVSVSVLKQSALTTCPHVAPLAINREPLPADLLLSLALQGGFGSTDGTYNFSPLRYWSLSRINGVDDQYVSTASVNKGFPTFGDSGSALLHRFPDGSLRVLGVASVGDDFQMFYHRLDRETAFLDSAFDTQVVCGAAPKGGLCQDDVTLSCAPQGFTSRDCRASGLACRAKDQVVGCGCACDTSSACEAGCACDLECAAPPDAGVPVAPEPAPERGGCQSVGSEGSLGALLLGALASRLPRRRPRRAR